MRALIVGVAQYQSSSWLNYTDDDAIDMRDMLMANPMWDPANITTLVNSQATKANIQSQMAYYASVTGPGDTFLFLFSGHGDYNTDVGPLEDDEEDGMDEYLCPYDSGVDPQTGQFDYDTMISDDELALWLEDINAAQRVVIIDTCYSGGMTKGVYGGKKGPPITIKAISQHQQKQRPLVAGDGFAEDLVRPKKPPAPGVEGSKDIDDTYVNTFVIMACDEFQLAVEEPYLQNGLLIYYVLEAGYSLHSDLNSDGYLSVEEIFAYLEPWVTSYWGSFGAGFNRQYPQALDTNPDAEINFMAAPRPRASTIFMEDDLDEDPGWEIVPDDVMPRWEFGAPFGFGGQSGDPDPPMPYSWLPDAEEPSVYGYFRYGDYYNNMGVETLTMPPVDLTGHWSGRLQFWRWLGVEQIYWDEAAIQVSIDDGVTWVDVWRNIALSISDTQWMFCDIDLGRQTDFQSSVQVRWVMGPTDFSLTFCGWNIDDVKVVATRGYILTLNDGTNVTTTTYDAGDVVTITCVPPVGMAFNQWIGDVATVADLVARQPPSPCTTTMSLRLN